MGAAVTKVCNACGERKPHEDFYRQPKASDGRMGKCKECHKAAVILRSRTNPAVQEYDRQRAKLPHRREKAKRRVPSWRAENPALYQAQNAVNNAIRDGKLKRGKCCADCGSKKNLRGLPVDPSKPLDRVIWRCALCQHRGRFEVAS